MNYKLYVKRGQKQGLLSKNHDGETWNIRRVLAPGTQHLVRIWGKLLQLLRVDLMGYFTTEFESILGGQGYLAPHSSTLGWKIPWMEEPGRLQSMGSLRVGHDWATSLRLFTFTHWRRKWQPIPVFLPEESQGQGSLVGCRLWGRTESDMTEVTQQQQQQGVPERVSIRSCICYETCQIIYEYCLAPCLRVHTINERLPVRMWPLLGFHALSPSQVDSLPSPSQGEGLLPAALLWTHSEVGPRPPRSSMRGFQLKVFLSGTWGLPSRA